LLGIPSPVTAHDPITAFGADDAFNLREDEVAEQDRGEDTEVNETPHTIAMFVLFGLTPGERQESNNKDWTRRQWEVLPLRTTAVRRNSNLFSDVPSFEPCLWLNSVPLLLAMNMVH
jgi:hypothetical protein